MLHANSNSLAMTRTLLLIDIVERQLPQWSIQLVKDRLWLGKDASSNGGRENKALLYKLHLDKLVEIYNSD